MGEKNFKLRSNQWQSHLRWIKFHLTYFTPLPSPATGRLQWRNAWLDALVQMAGKAIIKSGFQLPDPARLRRVLHQFLIYSIRGRMGKYNHLFMIRHEDSPIVQSKLFGFAKKRLVLKGAAVTQPLKKTKITKRARAHQAVAAKTKRKPKLTAHRKAAAEPEVRKLIKLLEEKWDDLTGEERTRRVTALLAKGCKIRGLAEDIGRLPSLVRYYAKRAPDSPRQRQPKDRKTAQPVRLQRPRQIRSPAATCPLRTCSITAS